MSVGSGEKAWIPRAEDLAKRRGMSELEKLILLTLVGVVISQELKKVRQPIFFSLLLPPTCFLPVYTWGYRP